jgi:hypothetical protein
MRRTLARSSSSDRCAYGLTDASASAVPTSVVCCGRPKPRSANQEAASTRVLVLSPLTKDGKHVIDQLLAVPGLLADPAHQTFGPASCTHEPFGSWPWRRSALGGGGMRQPWTRNTTSSRSFIGRTRSLFPKSRCKVSTGADDCVSSIAATSSAATETLAGTQDRQSPRRPSALVAEQIRFAR